MEKDQASANHSSILKLDSKMMAQSEKRMQYAAWHLMNMVICEMVIFCQRLAMESELIDLKGLIKADSLCEVFEDKPGSLDVEMELLSILDDEVIGIVLDSIDRVINCREVLVMINNIDLEKVVYDKPSLSLAGDAANCGAQADITEESYEGVVKYFEVLYFDLQCCIYVCSAMFTEKTISVFNGEYEEEFCENFVEIFEREVVSEDKNASLLLELIAALQEDCIKIERLNLKF